MAQKKKKTTKKKPAKKIVAAAKKPTAPAASPISTLPPQQKYPFAVAPPVTKKSQAADISKEPVGAADRLAIVRLCLGTLFKWVRLTAKAPALLKRRDIVVKLRKAIQELDAGHTYNAKAMVTGARLDLQTFLAERIAAGRKDLVEFKI